ncbi:MAG TPA: hypothetical protein VHR45_06355, partial [Thermoanaerobaculia bacterium]|nr:hypothetical protein [Thermoanaerobaculia bacterium]
MAPAKRLALNGLQAPSNDDGGQSPARLQLVPRGDGRDQAKRARNAERQRRFRERNAARRAVARYVTLGVTLGASFVTPDVTLGVTHDVTPVTPGSNAEDGARCDSNAPLARLHPARPAPSSRELSNAPARAERDLAAEFEAWFAAYPRQEGESRAQLAWMAERELPPLGVLLERLATQKTAKPQANFW